MAKLIKKSLGISCTNSERINELMRCIRFNITDLVDGLNQETLREMSLGLAHGLGRYKLKFSADKVDIMVIQAVSLHGDLDKEINNYMMRLREWYGYHFPELSQIVSDNMIYTKLVKIIGMRSNIGNVDLSEEVPDDVEHDIKEAAEISMGTEITEKDAKFIECLADQILELNNNRDAIGKYLESRMMAVAPNLSTVVGETIAAKLIARAGSLIGLAKFPASTIQILGAEKALFKAMKEKKPTPKFGIIYSSKMISSCSGRTKGKISRTMSAKMALCVRLDALGEDVDSEFGEKTKKYLEERIEYLTKQEASGKMKAPARQSFGQRGGFRSGGGYNSGGDFLGKRGPKKTFRTSIWLSRSLPSPPPRSSPRPCSPVPPSR